MNEEHEKQTLGLGVLGDLPDDILHERGERVYKRTPVAGNVSNGRAATRAKQSQLDHVKADAVSTGVLGAPEYKRDVQSTFDVRPVNAVDKLFGGTIQLRVPV